MPRGLQLLAQLHHRRECGLAIPCSRGQVGIVNVTIVSMQASGLQSRQ